MLHFISQDITKVETPFTIIHIGNCKGVMGSGVARQLREVFPEIYDDYINAELILGNTVTTRIDDMRVIHTVLAQENYGHDGRCYLDTEALKESLMYINDYEAQDNYTRVVYIPYKMGADRAGGNWQDVCKLVEETLDCLVNVCRLDN